MGQCVEGFGSNNWRILEKCLICYCDYSRDLKAFHWLNSAVGELKYLCAEFLKVSFYFSHFEVCVLITTTVSRVLCWFLQSRGKIQFWYSEMMVIKIINPLSSEVSWDVSTLASQWPDLEVIPWLYSRVFRNFIFQMKLSQDFWMLSIHFP